MKTNFLSNWLVGLGCLAVGNLYAQTPKPATPAAKTTTAPTKNFYNIRIKIDGYLNDSLILGYRLGKQTYVKDTCIGKNSKGEFVFSKPDTLKGGVYLALLKPDNSYFEFLIPNDKDQQNMSIYTKLDESRDMTKHLKIEGSEDNRVFIDYLHFLGSLRKKGDELGKQREASKSDTAKVAQIDKQLNALNDEVTTYQKNLQTKYPKYLSANLIKASGNPVVPKEIEAQGQEAAYRYYKAHYFDDLDWSDARLIRTPILEEKIEFFLEKLVFQVPDSLNKGVDELMGLVIKGKNKDMYQYVAAHLLNKYAKSQVICMDAVYVHIGEKYYCKGGAEWVEPEQLEKICDNVAELTPIRCGQPALEIDLKNIQDSSRFKLSSLVGKTRFTVLFFWDPSCGNCGKASARLAPVYDRFKPFGVEVVGVCSDEWSKADNCRRSAKEKGMKWINLSDESYPLAVVKKTYGIKMNPFIYLYDKDMKLMFKRLDPEQVEDILQREFQRMLDDKNSKELAPQERPAIERSLKELAVERKKRDEEAAKEKAKEKEKGTSH